jgi:hypothetical protein
MSAPGVTIRAMPGDLELMPVRVLPAGPGAGPAVLAGELLGRVRAELPVVGELGEGEQVLVSAWLTGLRSARTRRAYAGDVAAWLGWAATQLDAGVAVQHASAPVGADLVYQYCAASKQGDQCCHSGRWGRTVVS